MGTAVADGFGKRLARALKHSGKSQRDLAEQVGITEAQLSRYKTGSSRPRIDNARKLAAACGVQHEWLLYNKGPGPGEPMEQQDRALFGAVLTGAISEEEAALIRAYRRLKDPHRELVDNLARQLVEVEADRPQAS